MEEDQSKIINECPIFLNRKQKNPSENLNGYRNKLLDFDQKSILKQLEDVNVAIKKIETQNIAPEGQKLERKVKTKTSYSTRAGSLQSPKSIDLDSATKTTSSLKKYAICLDNRTRSQQSHSESVRLESSNKRMIKIKSKKHMLRVYNPFPVDMSDML